VCRPPNRKAAAAFSVLDGEARLFLAVIAGKGLAMLCSRCKKNIATVFLTRNGGNKPITTAFVPLRQEQGIAPVNDLIEKNGNR
jgi:hypothetical protein